MIEGGDVDGEARWQGPPDEDEVEWKVAHLEGNSQIVLGCSGLLDIIRKTQWPTRHEAALMSLRALRGVSAVFSDGQFYRYDPPRGVWDVISNDDIKFRIAAYDGSQHGDGRKRINLGSGAVESALASAAMVLSISGFFEHAAHGVATPECTWLVRGRQLQQVDHSPDHRLRYCYPVSAHTGGDELDTSICTPIDAPLLAKLAPTYIRFLSTVQPFDRYGQALEFIRSLVGVSMVGLATRYQMGALLAGTLAGANGKSTMLDLFRRIIFPPGTVASTDPGDWQNDYQRSSLVGAWANLIDEIGEWPRRTTSRVKGAVNGNPLEARRLGGDVFLFKPRAGWIVGANGLPNISGVDGAFWRRWAILDFDQTIPAHKRVPDHEIIEGCRHELPVLLMMFLQGLQRTLAEGRLPAVASADQYRKDLQREADQLSMWAADDLRWEGDDVDWIPIDRLYIRYEAWREMKASRRQVAAVTRVDFGRRLAQWGRAKDAQAGVEPGTYYREKQGGGRPAQLFCGASKI